MDMVLTLSLLIWLAERARQQLAGACQRAIRRPGDWKWLLHEPTNYPHVKFRVSAVLIRCFYPVFTAPAQPSPAACRPDSNKLNVQIILFLELHDTALITSLSFIFSDSAVYCYRYFFLFLPFILKRKQLWKALWMWIKDIDIILRVKTFNFCFFEHLHANHLSLLFPERRHNFVEESSKSKRHKCNVSKYF